MGNKALMHKRNDDLSFVGRCKLPSGSWTATAALGLSDADDSVPPFAALTATVTPMSGGPDVDGYTHDLVISHAKTGQTLWPCRLVDCDVQFVRASDGFTKSTPTFKVKIEKDLAT